MSIPVVADADVLFSATTRGLLVYLDYQGLIKLHWSLLILDEVSRALVDTGRKKSLADAKDFDKGNLETMGIALRKPDDFLRDLFERQPHDFALAFRRLRTDLASLPEVSVLLQRLHRDGQVQIARAFLAAHNAEAVRL